MLRMLLMITRFWINSKSATTHLVIDLETDSTLGTHPTRIAAQQQRDQLTARWNDKTRTTTINSPKTPIADKATKP